MNNATAQLVASYEEAEMSPEDIARIEGLDINAVKAALFTHSAKYRESVGNIPDTTTTTGPDKDFEAQDNELALRVIKRIAEYSEDDNLALKAAMYIRNDKKKRLDPVKQVATFNMNIGILNDHFAKAAAHDAAKVLPASKQPAPIDI